MHLLWFFLLSLFCFYRAYKWYRHYKKYRHIKGPSLLLSLPLVGQGYMLGADPIAALYRMRAKYGPVFRLDVGSIPAVFVCRLTDLQEAFRSEAVNGRPFIKMASFAHIRPVDGDGCPAGVVTSLGRTWYEQRRFMMRHLSDLGMGKGDTMEEVIGQECQDFVNRFKKIKGPVQVKGIFNGAVNNVIWRMITGKRTRQDDPELRHLTLCVTKFLHSLDPGNPLSLLTHNSVAFCKLCSWLGVDNVIDACKVINDMIEEEISGSVADPNGNYIERFLHEMEINENEEYEMDQDIKESGANGTDETSAKVVSSFAGENGRAHLRGHLQDIFVAGTETSATSLEWMLLYLVEFSESQEKIFQELSALLGPPGEFSSRPLKLTDRVKLNYAEAFIEEVSRHCPQGAVPIPHMTMQDCVIGGYKVPKGTQVFPFGTAINHNPSPFPDPETFDVNRFLDQNTGRYLHRSDEYLFFGVGKRRCPGEALGKAEIFYFLMSLVYNFKLVSAESNKLDFEPIPGLTFHPKPFKIQFQPRWHRT